ncbi:TetR/AcrR family transcriptional regulator [Spirosoma areae]
MPRAKDDTKIEAIHEAARTLVLRTGFSGLKMADVAKEAGLATGTLYVYYNSKEALVAEAFADTKQRIATGLLGAKVVEGNYYESFQNLWKAYFSYCYAHPAEMLFVEQFMYSGYLPEDARKKANDFYLPLDHFIDAGKQSGILLNTDTEIIKAQLMGSIHEIIKYSLHSGLTIDAPLMELCCNMAWNSVRR